MKHFRLHKELLPRKYLILILGVLCVSVLFPVWILYRGRVICNDWQKVSGSVVDTSIQRGSNSSSRGVSKPYYEVFVRVNYRFNDKDHTQSISDLRFTSTDWVINQLAEEEARQRAEEYASHFKQGQIYQVQVDPNNPENIGKCTIPVFLR